MTATTTTEGFGQTVAATGTTASAYGFAATSGYRADGDAGLSLVGARYCDAQVGRFITRDTELDQLGYVYCGGDPVNAVDPSGHDPVSPWMAAAASTVRGFCWPLAGLYIAGKAVTFFSPPGSIGSKIGGTMSGASDIGLGIIFIAGGAELAGVGAIATPEAPPVGVGGIIGGCAAALGGISLAVIGLTDILNELR